MQELGVNHFLINWNDKHAWNIKPTLRVREWQNALVLPENKHYHVKNLELKTFTKSHILPMQQKMA